MSLYEASVPSQKFTLSANSPLVKKTLNRIQVISTEDMGSQLVQSKIENAQFLGARLVGQHWAHSDLVTSELSGTEFVQSTLKNVKFDRCALNGVTFEQCYLDGVRMDGQDLTTDVKFVRCTILDEHGHLGKMQDQMTDCVYLGPSDFVVVAAVKKTEPSVAKRSAEIPAPKVPDPQAPSRFNALEV